VVQIAHLAGERARRRRDRERGARLGPARRFEPIPHVSSHGALHREHMLVPAALQPPRRAPPRRTTDVMPSVLARRRLPVPGGLDGASFF
jgi:hypothetical protein